DEKQDDLKSKLKKTYSFITKHHLKTRKITIYDDYFVLPSIIDFNDHSDYEHELNKEFKYELTRKESFTNMTTFDQVVADTDTNGSKFITYRTKSKLNQDGNSDQIVNDCGYNENTIQDEIGWKPKSFDLTLTKEQEIDINEQPVIHKTVGELLLLQAHLRENNLALLTIVDMLQTPSNIRNRERQSFGTDINRI
ncbi:unnamed protein product, partial [Didymodactylos carnosus]